MAKKILLKIFLAAVITVFSYTTSDALPWTDVTGKERWTLSDAGMVINVPEHFSVVTKGEVSNPQVYEKMGLNVAQAFLSHRGVVLEGVSLDDEFGFTVRASEVDDFKKISDIRELGGKALEELIAALIEGHQKSNFISAYDQKIEINSVAYFIFNGMQTIGSTVVPVRQYFAIYNGKAVSFNLVSFVGQITDRQTDMLLDIMKNTSFLKEEVPKSVVANKESSTSSLEKGIVFLGNVAMGVIQVVVICTSVVATVLGLISRIGR